MRKNGGCSVFSCKKTGFHTAFDERTSAQRKGRGGMKQRGLGKHIEMEAVSGGVGGEGVNSG